MSDNMQLTPGQRILCRDAEWLITRVQVTDISGSDYQVHCVGVDDLVRGHEAIFLTQLDTIVPVDPRHTKLMLDDSKGYRLSRLFLEAQLRQMPWSGRDPHVESMGVFNSLAFQEETVKKALNQLRPRLLLADAVGLGKTIQVGMVLTELIRRGRANRILVLAKKSMLTQFQAELWNRFNIPLVRLDSEGIARLRLQIPANKNPFEVFHRVIISIDTLKNVGRFEHILRETRWDAVVIDEAHNVAGASVPDRHLSYRLARLLSRRCDAMLLTTATPHNGKRETFGRLISLLDPSAIPDPDLKEYDANDVHPFVLMRFKEDIRDQVQTMLAEREVIPRQATTTDATPGEEAVFEAMAHMRENASSWKGNRLFQYGLYKLFLSSPEACQHTVDGRINKLQKEQANTPELAALQGMKPGLDKLSLQESARYQNLKQQLKEIEWSPKGDTRVLVFTEYRHTQNALAEALAKDFKVKRTDDFEKQPEQVIAVIHGTTSDKALQKTIEAFGTGNAPMRMLIATDVASEGVNLHHACHHIIHYDLPWSIITLVQRNGRVDRLGQTVPPQLRYLMVDTAQSVLQGDTAIFERLIQKVEEINHLRQSGESQLQLYDAQKEEEYIAQSGILAGDVNVLDKQIDAAQSEAALLEQLLGQMNLTTDASYQAFLDGSDTETPEATPTFRPIRLMDDMTFLKDGYDFLVQQHDDYLPLRENGPQVMLTAPSDLKRRLGAPNERGDVIFGATAIPREAWPKNDQFTLTDDPARVDMAITAERNFSGYWAKELLCNEQHPISRWLVERILMQVPRGSAPLVTSTKLPDGELVFGFIGQVSSRAGTPLIVDAHAICVLPGGETRHEPLEQALKRAAFDTLMTTGNPGRLEVAQMLVGAAVEQSIEHLKALNQNRAHTLQKPVRTEERRLRRWANTRQRLLEQQIEKLGESHSKTPLLKTRLEEIGKFIQDRKENWFDMHFLAAPNPTTQLLLVIQGER